MWLFGASPPSDFNMSAPVNFLKAFNLAYVHEILLVPQMPKLIFEEKLNLQAKEADEADEFESQAGRRRDSELSRGAREVRQWLMQRADSSGLSSPRPP